MVSIAAVAVICIGVIVAERKSERHDDALGGAYYAVTKPPAFNFNRKLLSEVIFLLWQMISDKDWCTQYQDSSRTLGSMMEEVLAGMRKGLSRSWLAGTIINCRSIT